MNIDFRCEAEIIEVVESFFSRQGATVLFSVFEDPGDNPHYHGIVQLKDGGTIRAITEARRRDESFFNYKGQQWFKMSKSGTNSDFQLACKTLNNPDVRDQALKYLRYLCKGKNAKVCKKVGKAKFYDLSTKSEPSIRTNILCDESDINRLHGDFWADFGFRQRNDTVNKVSSEPRKSEFEKIYDYCVERGLTHSTNGWDIGEWLVEYYHSQNRNEPNDFQIRCYAKSVYRKAVLDSQQPESVKKNYLRQRAISIIGHEWVSAV